MSDAPIANRADTLQLPIGDDALAGIAQRFLQMANGILLEHKSLQNSVEREEVSSRSHLTLKARERLDRRFGLAEGLERGTKLVVTRQLLAEPPAHRRLVHPALHFNTVTLQSR